MFKDKKYKLKLQINKKYRNDRNNKKIVLKTLEPTNQTIMISVLK